MQAAHLAEQARQWWTPFEHRKVEPGRPIGSGRISNTEEFDRLLVAALERRGRSHVTQQQAAAELGSLLLDTTITEDTIRYWHKRFHRDPLTERLRPWAGVIAALAASGRPRPSAAP
jgi:hypothetical protein